MVVLRSNLHSPCHGCMANATSEELFRSQKASVTDNSCVCLLSIFASLLWLWFFSNLSTFNQKWEQEEWQKKCCWIKLANDWLIPKYVVWADIFYEKLALLLGSICWLPTSNHTKSDNQHARILQNSCLRGSNRTRIASTLSWDWLQCLGLGTLLLPHQHPKAIFKAFFSELGFFRHFFF